VLNVKRGTFARQRDELTAAPLNVDAPVLDRLDRLDRVAD